MLLTNWNDWIIDNFGTPEQRARYAYEDGVHYSSQRAQVSGLSPTQWHWVRFRWMHLQGDVFQMEWYVNTGMGSTPPASWGAPIRRTRDACPDESQQMHFNIWTPDSSWPDAYSASLTPGTPQRIFALDVDKVYTNTATLSGDTTSPSVTVTRPQSGYSYHPSLNPLTQATGTTSDAGGSGLSEVLVRLIRYDTGQQWNGSAWVYGDEFYSNAIYLPASTSNGWANWSFTMPPASQMPDGKYGLRALARDNAGNMSASHAYDVLSPQFSGYFYIDTTPPTVAITQPVYNGSYSSLAQATGTAADNVGISSTPPGVQLRLQRGSDSLYWNGSSWVSGPIDLTATGTTSWSYTLPSLATGSYTFSVRARDYVGNWSAWTSRAFSITALSITVSTPQHGGSYWPSTLRQATGSTTGNVSTVHGILQRISDAKFWNGTGWQAGWAQPLASGTTNWTWNFPPAASLPTGQYYFYARAYDVAGNEVLTGEHYITINNTTTFTVDKPVGGTTYWPSQIEFASGTITGDIIRINTTLQRISDGLFWNGSSWVAGQYTFIDETDFAGTRTWQWPMPRAQMAPGGYRFFMQPQDTAGNAPFIERDFNYNPAPTLVVNRPLYNGAYTSSQIPSATGTITGEIWRMNYQLQRAGDGWC